MSASESEHEQPSGIGHAAPRDPWPHHHGEGERGESVPSVNAARPPATMAHLIGEPVVVRPQHHWVLLAIVIAVAVVVALIVLAR